MTTRMTSSRGCVTHMLLSGFPCTAVNCLHCVRKAAALADLPAFVTRNAAFGFPPEQAHSTGLTPPHISITNDTSRRT